MTGNEYQELASRTINRNLEPNELNSHAVLGMVSEVGEICGLYQKEFQGHQYNETELKKEVGDLLWFVAEFCTANGWDVEEIMDMNITKLKRRYPDGFEVERSVTRDKNS